MTMTSMMTSMSIVTTKAYLKSQQTTSINYNYLNFSYVKGWFSYVVIHRRQLQTNVFQMNADCLQPSEIIIIITIIICNYNTNTNDNNNHYHYYYTYSNSAITREKKGIEKKTIPKETILNKEDMAAATKAWAIFIHW